MKVKIVLIVLTFVLCFSGCNKKNIMKDNGKLLENMQTESGKESSMENNFPSVFDEETKGDVYEENLKLSDIKSEGSEAIDDKKDSLNPSINIVEIGEEKNEEFKFEDSRRDDVELTDDGVVILPSVKFE